jgi:hypothetical protein
VALGHPVVAIEPTEELRRGAILLHPSPMIEWLDDSLSDLAAVRARKEEFDLVMLTAVRNGGIVIMSLGMGRSRPGRRIFEVLAEETIALTRCSNLFCTLNREAGLRCGQAGVSWTRLGFQKDIDGNTS